MSSSSFPLLRLPFLALREIIEQMDIKQQFNLSLCSKRMHFAAKNYRRKSPMPLKLFSVRGDVNIFLLKEKYPEDEVVFKVKDAEGNSHRRGSSEQIRLTKLLVCHLCDLFTARVEKVFARNDKFWMLDIIEGQQGGYSYDAIVLNSYGYGRNDDHLRHILLDLNPRSLDITYKASDQFRIEKFQKKYENLTISAASWVTVENLCQLDCVELRIYNRKFSSTEINRYFEHVLSGGAPRLRKFWAEVRDPTENLMDGIEELLTGSERVEDEDGIWYLNGKVAREEGLVLVRIKFFGFGVVYLKIKDA